MLTDGREFRRVKVWARLAATTMSIARLIAITHAALVGTCNTVVGAATHTQRCPPGSRRPATGHLVDRVRCPRTINSDASRRGDVDEVLVLAGYPARAGKRAARR